MNGSRRWIGDLAIGLALVGAVMLVYGQVWNHEFVLYDDDRYVLDNPFVNAGLSWNGVAWAFTHAHASNWHPLTWISHMIDCQLFGLEPGPQHLTSVLLHAANGLLLFLALRLMTRSLWPCALVAALFALHPLRVQSVAWIAERKDVLSGLFWMLALVAYAHYANRPTWRRFALVFGAMALGLMAKPMLVTLPLVLLLLDYWPLGRFGPGGAGRTPASRLLLEKLPLLALSAGSGVITFLSQKQAGSVFSTEALPLTVRVENALVSYVAYLWKTLWPAGLAVHYPHPGSGGSAAPWLAGAAAFSAMLLVAATLFLLRGSKRRPYLGVGWLWYLGTLVPVIGLVQVGPQGMADRYTYLPMIGVYILVAWSGCEFAGRSSRVRNCLGPAALLIVLAYATASWFQTRYWRDSATLFRRALQVTRDNAVAHNNLGNWLVAGGRVDEGVEHLEQAARLLPDSPKVLASLGDALIKQGRIDEAVPPLVRAVEAAPGLFVARRNLAYALLELGRLDEADVELTRLMAERPDDALIRHKLGQLRLRQGRVDDAAAELREAARLDSGSPELLTELGMVTHLQGQTAEAVRRFREALALRPGYFLAHHRLAVVLLESGRPTDAVAELRAAIASEPGFAPSHRLLVTALRSAGDEAGAREAEARLRELAPGG